jgi:membrane protein involved in colicin uptake
MKIVKKALQTVSKELKGLGKKTDQLVKAVDKLEKAQAAKKRKATVKAKKTRKAPAKKTRAKKAAAKKTAAKKKAAPTATNRVLSVIKKSKQGVDVPALIKKTGLEDKQIRNIVFRAFKQGKIKRAGRGAYVSA